VHRMTILRLGDVNRGYMACTIVSARERFGAVRAGERLNPKVCILYPRKKNARAVNTISLRFRQLLYSHNAWRG